jgi:hypothetical protein
MKVMFEGFFLNNRIVVLANVESNKWRGIRKHRLVTKHYIIHNGPLDTN